MPHPLPVKFAAALPLAAAFCAAFAAVSMPQSSAQAQKAGGGPAPPSAAVKATPPPPLADAQEEGHIHLAPLPPAIRVIAPDKLLGTLAPDFSLPDPAGVTHTLSAQRGKWVVLAFYPVVLDGDSRTENRSLSAALDRFTQANAVIFGISTQDVANQKTFTQKDGLRHALLADVGGAAAKTFRVQGNRNGFAERVTIYVAPDGTIARVDEAVRPATAGDDALATLADLARTWKPGTPPVPVPAEDAATPILAIGAPAPAFELTEATIAASGTMPRRRTLGELRAGKKATVLVFLSVECPCANSYNARLSRLAAEYAGRGVAVVGINANASEDAPAVAAHAAKHGLTFPVFKDLGARAADALGAQNTPEAFVFDASGVLVYHGAIDDSRDPAGVRDRHVARALDAVLAYRPVPVSTVEATGCSIERAAAP